MGKLLNSSVDFGLNRRTLITAEIVSFDITKSQKACRAAWLLLWNVVRYWKQVCKCLPCKSSRQHLMGREFCLMLIVFSSISDGSLIDFLNSCSCFLFDFDQFRLLLTDFEWFGLVFGWSWINFDWFSINIFMDLHLILINVHQIWSILIGFWLMFDQIWYRCVVIVNWFLIDPI